ncbi:MAG: hypothetical protein A2527_03765 [Candidatus Lambdaproteobacteria bacterium RIFOXYD2_FULL_50_16]|uniref:CheW-like domain-containing protein n=1 Tax=Candidatus Lambdaproteobacteria bacterium RIFOXYD2_FULL_50_16 TaxID=1817772 RepID=A0A1F6GF00_9PROT|nr:MAG: hypothetical protein A2527_03765 [Candidatus Lambdaproteobacteria bacterium RIFOXYD2_FULL_50_16]
MSKTDDFFNATGGKLLTFLLGEQEYGIRIDHAREVVGQMAIDKVPQTPNYLMGVTNLRGKIVPVLNLRLKLGMEAVPPTGETCIIVVSLGGAETGILVDFLVGVVTIGQAEFTEGLDLGEQIDTQFIYGMGKIDKRVIAILEVGSLVESLDL